MQICLRIVNQMGHIHVIKAFLNFRKFYHREFGGYNLANVALRGPIQGTIRSEAENGINLRNILF